MRPLRVWVIGCGTVGRWLLQAVQSQADRLAARFGVRLQVVGVANARHGFVYDADGLDVASILELEAGGESIAEQRGSAHWPTAIDGMRATEADILVEVTGSPADGEPGFTHMREALARGIPVVTSNKWPVALHGVELSRLAESARVGFRAESTVMSGTPVVGPLTEGLAGARPVSLRGILNATSNFILTAMMSGHSYERALEEAEAAGLAERGVEADVDGSDAAAKAMILAALVFGRQLRPDDVSRRGIDAIAEADVRAAVEAGRRVRPTTTLAFAEPDGGGAVTARVEPLVLSGDDPLANIAGTTNAIVCTGDPLGEVTLIGPGAGLELAGQGVFSDLIAVARARARDAALHT